MIRPVNLSGIGPLAGPRFSKAWHLNGGMVKDSVDFPVEQAVVLAIAEERFGIAGRRLWEAWPIFTPELAAWPLPSVYELYS